MDLAALAQCAILKGLSPDERGLFFPLAETESFETGAIIYRQDTPAEKVYVLDQGSVALKTVLPAESGNFLRNIQAEGHALRLAGPGGTLPPDHHSRLPGRHLGHFL